MADDDSWAPADGEDDAATAVLNNDPGLDENSGGLVSGMTSPSQSLSPLRSSNLIASTDVSTHTITISSLCLRDRAIDPLIASYRILTYCAVQWHCNK